MGQSLQTLCRRAGCQVRFGPKTDLIAMPIRWHMLLDLYSRAEEYGHAGSCECDPRAEASAVEQGKADRGKATTATQTRLVDSDEAPDRRSRSRPRHVQSGNRQQTSRL